MSQNMRGAYVHFTHDRPQDWAWLAEWQPNVIRLMLQGSHTDPASVSVSLIERVHQVCPNALILLRCWDVDDRNFEAHEAMAQNPVAEANKQLEWWNKVVWRIQGVPHNQIIVGLNNEVHPSKNAALYEYTKRALVYGTEFGLRVGAGVFSVGNPALPGDDAYDMAKFSELEPLFLAGDHVLVLHEYMQPEGMYAVWTDSEGKERKDYSYLIGRHKRWPMQRVKKIIGEWGVDGILYNRNPHPNYGNSGWRSFPGLWSAERFADEYVACIQDADDSVIGICPFITDFADGKWASFDTLPAHDALLARKHLCEREIKPEQQTTHLPQVSKAVSQNNATAVDSWGKSRAFVKKWEGGYTDDPNDHGNWTGGRKGVGELKGTKFGISAASYPHLDIRNLTIEQADSIYFRDYWQASGANKLPYPYCLLVFDTAVLHGVGAALKWQLDVGDNAYAFAAKRLRVYTKLDNWHYYGAGWTNRVADLLEVAGA